MIAGLGWVGLSALALVMLGLSAGCAVAQHDCYESRDCPESAGGGSNRGGAGGLGAAGSGEQREPDSTRAGSPEAAGSSAIAEGGTSGGLEPPRVLSVSPGDAALGVTGDARIVITFSQPMDTAATEAAYESSELPGAALNFSWNESATTLTLSPHTPLQYATSPNAASADLEFPARVYHYGFDDQAVDQLGQPLAPTHFTFSTLRQVSAELKAQREYTGNWTLGEDEGIHNCLRKPEAGYEPTVCIGDDLNNVRYSGFLSFDLSALPKTIARFTSARLLGSALVHGAPAELGASQLEHVVYGELGETALAVTPISAPSPLFLATTLIDDAPLALDLEVTAALADDYENRAARVARSQYRLAFAKVLANGHWDDVELPTSSIHLSVNYLLP